jgi:hypothetical protein
LPRHRRRLKWLRLPIESQAAPTDEARSAKPLAYKISAVIIGVALMPVIGYFDYLTGYEVSLFPLYAIPIAWIAWSVGLTWGMALGIIASSAWLWADRASGHHYNYEWIRWEKAVMHAILFGFVAFSFNRFKRNIESRTRKVRLLEGILPICIACHRIKDSRGNWADLDTYLRAHSEAKPEQCICPDCLGGRYR